MSQLKKNIWVGSAKDDLMELPPEVKDEIGYGLHQAQAGLFPDYAKPLKGINGVFEIVSNFDKNTYRTIYATKLGSFIYVLHVFQKKSKSGISTPKQDVELIMARLKIAKQHFRGII